jgi:hypothetical protein
MSPPIANRRWLLGAVLCVLVAAGADAQTTSEPVGRLQAGVGVGWLGGAVFGEQPADLRAASGGPFRLFESETDLGGSGAFEARVGILLTRRYGIEGRAAAGRPELRTVISSDAETTGSFTLIEQVDQYLFEGGIVIRLDEWETSGLTPFAAAGLGYVRQLHEGEQLGEDGHLFYVGGGFTHALFSRAQGLIRAASVRADLRLNLISMDLDEGSRPRGSVSGGIVLTF